MCAYQHGQDGERREEQEGHDAERRRGAVDPRFMLVVPEILDVEIPEVEGEGQDGGGRHDQCSSLASAYIDQAVHTLAPVCKSFSSPRSVLAAECHTVPHVVADHIPILILVIQVHVHT